MSLKSLSLPRREIHFNEGSFKVRGLSFSDILSVFQTHKEDIRSATSLISNTDQINEDSLQDPMSLAAPLIAASPDIAAKIIAIAAAAPGESDEQDVEIVKNLPVPVQLEALEHIAELTFMGEGGAKKFLERLIRTMTGVTGIVESFTKG